MLLKSIIVAQDENRVIGHENKLLWNLPVDMHHFKLTTLNSNIIMGRKTHESINSVLPYRNNIVVTKNKNIQYPGCLMAHSLDEAFKRGDINKETFIIGGEQLFKEAMNLVDRLIVTWVHHKFTGDTYFPRIDIEKWKEVERYYRHMDKNNPYDISFVTYLKR